MCLKKTLPLFLFASILSLMLVSCQKEESLQHDQNPGNNGGDTTNSSSITGDWDFLGMTGSVESTINAQYQGQEVKVITTNGFATKNNMGTITITDSTFISSGVSYSIDTTVHIMIYLSDTLYGEIDSLFSTTLPPTSQTSGYQSIGTDSLSFPNGFVLLADSLAGGTEGPVGAKYTVSGDELLLNINTRFTRAVVQSGIPGVMNGTLTGIVRLKRK